MQKKMHFTLRMYMQKTIHSSLRFISKIYCIVLIPNYKRTYDQSDEIEN